MSGNQRDEYGKWIRGLLIVNALAWPVAVAGVVAAWITL